MQVLLISLALIPLAACGGSPAVTITVSPATANVSTSQVQQFTSTVTNASTTAVTWQVNGVTSGDVSTFGSISSAGLYTAPSIVPSPATVTITAISVADTNKTSTATVTIQLGANLAINPSSLSMTAGSQQTFVVTSNGQTPPAGQITFSLSCMTPGGCGSVTSDGVYTAPPTPPANGGIVILTVSFAPAAGKFSTSATITIVP